MPSPSVLLSVSSGGSGEPALDAVAQAFHEATGHSVAVIYNRDLPDCDVVVVAQSALDRIHRPAGRVEPGGIPLGRVGLGVAVRPGARRPRAATADDLARELASADRLLITRNHTSGLYVESLLRRLSIDQMVRIEYAENAPALLDRLLAGDGDEFTILSINEIATYNARGVELVAPLPDEVQHWVEFFAVPTTGSRHKALAWEFARFCGGPGRAILARHGFSQG
jgi:molybdate transport system substrate-binding protein